jgi:L-lactate dehydrogenase complex protein LldE
MAAALPQVRASLFVTCIIDRLYPEVGESTVNVLGRLGVDLDFPMAQTCCGQPAFNSGFWSDAKPLARRTIEALQSDRYVVVPSGSCASMIRVFYDELFHDEPQMRNRIASLASRTFELSEFIVDVLGISDLSPYADVGSTETTRKVTYHEGCHLRRELVATTQPRSLLNSLSSVEVVEMEQSEVCCGFGGTFSVKYPEISGAMLRDKIDFAAATGADALTACDSSCLMHIGGGIEKQGVAIEPLHIVQLLDEAMRG